MGPAPFGTAARVEEALAAGPTGTKSGSQAGCQEAANSDLSPPIASGCLHLCRSCSRPKSCSWTWKSAHKRAAEAAYKGHKTALFPDTSVSLQAPSRPACPLSQALAVPDSSIEPLPAFERDSFFWPAESAMTRWFALMRVITWLPGHRSCASSKDFFAVFDPVFCFLSLHRSTHQYYKASVSGSKTLRCIAISHAILEDIRFEPKSARGCPGPARRSALTGHAALSPAALRIQSRPWLLCHRHVLR